MKVDKVDCVPGNDQGRLLCWQPAMQNLTSIRRTQCTAVYTAWESLDSHHAATSDPSDQSHLSTHWAPN